MISTQIIFTPLLPWPLLCLLSAAAFIAVAAARFARARGAALRGAGFAFLLAILAGPHWQVRATAPLPDIAVILVDRSQSMDIGNRHAMAATALASLLASNPGAELRIVDIPPADGGGTSLFATLQTSLDAIPSAQLAGIVAMTDGQIADTPAKLNVTAPFTALLTAKAPETDRELRLLDAPAYGLVGQNLTLRLVVLDHGANDTGALATITVTEDGTTIWRQNAPIGQPLDIRIPVNHAGPAIIEAAVTPLIGEVSQINNQTAFTLNGIRKRLNVLLISGSPDPGERTWRLLLKSDPAVQLIHFTILRTPGEFIDADQKDLALVPFPINQLFDTDIGKFDLIILDRFNTAGLLPPQYLANIATYTQSGGALLAELGPEFASPDSLALSPLGAILPATPAGFGTATQQFSPVVTILGSRHPVTAPFAAMVLPPWYRFEDATANSGDVLMTGPDNAPLLILGAAGKGRVGMLLSDQFWLWTRGGVHQGPALPLLRRIVHWLLREPSLEAESLTASITNGQLTIGRQTLSATYPGDAAVTAPDGKVTRLTLRQTGSGRYAAQFPAGQTGIWQIAEGGFTAYAANTPINADEYQDLAATAENLRPIARNIIWLGQTPTPALAPLLVSRHARQITGTRDIALLPPLPAMLVALALITAAWWRESRYK